MGRDGVVIVETVPPALAGERLDRIVAFVLDVSRSVATAVSAGATMAARSNASLTGRPAARRARARRRWSAGSWTL